MKRAFTLNLKGNNHYFYHSNLHLLNDCEKMPHGKREIFKLLFEYHY